MPKDEYTNMLLLSDCVNPGEMALTFDDGPFIYTSHILDVLAQYNASATFFITGNNNGALLVPLVF